MIKYGVKNLLEIIFNDEIFCNFVFA